MKKFGTFAALCAAFIGGMAFVYSCGGSGGSELNAQDLIIIEGKIDALALYVENMDAKIDSLLIHAQNTDSKLDSIDEVVVQTQNYLTSTVYPQINAIKSVVDSNAGVIDDIASFLGI